MRDMYDKLLLIFILVLGIIAVGIWTIFLVQMSQLLEQSTTLQKEHVKGAIDARENLITAKETAEKNVNMTKINKKNIENILNNISEITQKLNSNNITISQTVK